ncbi:helix-turn-helix domain-containing protein [uncultured Lacinutrix sp.]|uniref:helix-turn-helix domain-containing protein n=1 Tax=uncultured Lacinutrix sp. TaxID=574032 RepID=UPI00263946D5|nr:helix-turn-helix domain-containing protein [uncultured Lacinutrix sp.]
MSKEIPHIDFESAYSKVEGIEIITLESLIKRTKDLDHNPEKAHHLSFNILIYYTHGKSKHLVDFVWHDVQKNTLIHLSKGQVHAFKFNEDIKGFLIMFTEDYLKKQLNKLPKSEIIRLFNSHLFSPRIQVPENSNVEKYINLFSEEYFNEHNSYNKQKICDSLYTILFSKLEQLKQYQTFHLKNTEKLETFIAFKSLVEKYYTSSRNADFYASKLNITYKHLNVICKTIVDTTAKSFIDTFVILEAKRLLINSSIKSNELAFKMGFNEPTNFVKYFKKQTGLTPNSFKKEYL